MLPYLSIFAVLVAFGVSLSERQSRQLLPCALVFLLWFMGTRYYVGCDFTGYLSRFDNTPPPGDAWREVFRDEGGFGFLLGVILEADLDYMWLNVVCSMIFLACVLVFCRSFNRPMMTLALLFPIMIIQLGMSGLRQALAVGFLMLALVAFVRRRKIATAAMILVGGMFHASALLFLPIALLAGPRITSTRTIMAVLVGTPVAGLLVASRLQVYADRYIAEIYGEVTSSGAVIRYLLIVIPALLFMRHRKRLLALFPQVYPLFILFAAIIFAMLPVAAVSTVALHRLNYYLMPVAILMLVYVSQALSPYRKHTADRYFPALMYGLYSFTWFLTSRHAALCYIPYQSYTLL